MPFPEGVGGHQSHAHRSGRRFRHTSKPIEPCAVSRTRTKPSGVYRVGDHADRNPRHSPEKIHSNRVADGNGSGGMSGYSAEQERSQPSGTDKIMQVPCHLA